MLIKLKKYLRVSLPISLKRLLHYENYREFSQWCVNSAKEKKHEITHDLEKFVKARRSAGGERADQDFFSDLNASLPEGKVNGVLLNREFGKDKENNAWIIDGADEHVSLFRINRGGSLSINNLKIGEITIASEYQSKVELSLNNCEIGKLNIATPASLVSDRTKIGFLGLNENTINHLEIANGCILDIDCPIPEKNSPFLGSVSFVRVFLPRTKKGYPIKGPQPYRNMRAHLKKLENGQAVAIFHSAELALESEADTWTYKFLTKLYEGLSDFGSSAIRPFLWLLFLYLISMALIVNTNSAILAFPDDENAYIGWRNIFLEKTTAGDYARSCYLALQPIINPLGIFSTKPILVAHSGSLAFWLGVQGLFSVVLIALIILAIRRRFKMQ